MVDWIYKCGIQLYIMILLLKNFHKTSTPAACSSYIYSQNKSPTNLIGFPDGSVVKNPPANAGDVGLISGLGRSPGGGNGSPLQYSCLENPMGRGAWLATVQGVAKSCTWLNDWACKITFILLMNLQFRQGLAGITFLLGAEIIWSLLHLHVSLLVLPIDWNLSYSYVCD